MPSLQLSAVHEDEEYKRLVGQLASVEGKLKASQARLRKRNQNADNSSLCVVCTCIVATIFLFVLLVAVPHTQRNWDSLTNSTQTTINTAQFHFTKAKDSAVRGMHSACGSAVQWRNTFPHNAAALNRDPKKFFFDLGAGSGSGLDWIQQAYKYVTHLSKPCRGNVPETLLCLHQPLPIPPGEKSGLIMNFCCSPPLLHRDKLHEFEIHSFEVGRNQLPRLQEYIKHHGKLNVTLHKEAAWDSDGTIDMFYGGVGNRGFSIKQRPTRPISAQVTAVDFSKFLQRKVMAQDFVVVKMDIGLAEYPVIKRLVLTKTIKLIDRLIVRWHGSASATSVNDKERPKYYSCPNCTVPPVDVEGRQFLNPNQCRQRVYSQVLKHLVGEVEEWEPPEMDHPQVRVIEASK
eukprot:TRINITY_DN31148_c0_g1_i1.p1 TRINITY_DN31148_c0_g1~~TRINITY_DN31148_c0_g1_i1.p1  ORF type:complete len:402 (+),score=35.74 TRINITY_DN31148_c0_g1_i1:30-1235(+)